MSYDDEKKNSGEEVLKFFWLIFMHLSSSCRSLVSIIALLIFTLV